MDEAPTAPSIQEHAWGKSKESVMKYIYFLSLFFREAPSRIQSQSDALNSWRTMTMSSDFSSPSKNALARTGPSPICCLVATYDGTIETEEEYVELGLQQGIMKSLSTWMSLFDFDIL